MTPEETRAEVRRIVTRIELAEDPRVGIQLVRERMSEIRQGGQEVPEEFTWIEKRLAAECIDASQER